MAKKVSFNSTPIWIPANFNLHPICEALPRSRSLPNIAIEGTARIDPLYSIERLSDEYYRDLRHVRVTGKSLGSPLHRQIRPFFAMWRVRLNTATTRRAINHGRRRKSPSETAITPSPSLLQLRAASNIVFTSSTARQRLRIVTSGRPLSLRSLNAFADSASLSVTFGCLEADLSPATSLAAVLTPSAFVEESVIVKNASNRRRGEH